MANIAFILVHHADKEICGVRFSKFKSGVKSYFDIGINEVPELAVNSLVCFPHKLLYPNNGFLSTQEEINSGKHVPSANEEDMLAVKAIFSQDIFSTNFSNANGLLELAYKYGASLESLKDFHLGLTKHFSDERIQEVTSKMFGSKTLRFVFASLLRSYGGYFNDRSSKWAYIRFVKEKQHDERELIKLSDLNLNIDKKFGMFKFFYNIPVSVKEGRSVESVREEIMKFISSFNEDSPAVACTGLEEYDSPFGIVMSGEVLLISNSKVYAKMVDGEVYLPKVHASKLIEKVGNYNTEPEGIDEGKRKHSEFKEIVLRPKRIHGFWAYRSEREMHNMIDELSKHFKVKFKSLSL